MANRDLVVRFIGDDKDLQRAFRTSARSTRQFQAQIEGSSRGVRNLFAAAGVTLGAAGLVTAIRSTVNAALDFESSFAGVRKTVDATEPQLRVLSEGFRAMAREIPVSVDELNRVGEAAGQLGIRREAILGFTRTVADLGVTTTLTADAAADALARIANITRLPQDEFDRLGATIVELGNKLAATESEIVDFGLRIAAAGNIIGLTEAQTLAVAGAFTSVGVEAEAGGTAVSKVFIALANAAQSGGKQLELFAQTAGTSSAEFRRQFEQNSAGAFNAFVEGLARVDEEGGNVFKTLEQLGLTDVRLVRAFLSISQAGDLLERSLVIGSRAWRENAALTEEARKRYETTASQLQVFQNRVNDLQITLGNALAPALIKIVTPLGEWAQKTENQEDLQRKLTAVVGTATDIVRGLADAFRNIQPALERVNKLLGGTRNAVELLLTVFVVSKVVNFASAITGLGTASLATTGRVYALRTALLRLGAIGVITLGVELLLNKESIQRSVDGFLRKNRLGFLAGEKIEVPVDVNAQELKTIRDNLAAVKGEGDLLVKTLDKIIAKLIAAGRAGPIRPDDRAGPRGPGGIEAANRRLEQEARRAAEAAAKVINARGRSTAAASEEAVASTAVAKAVETETERKRRLLEVERERAEVRRDQRRSRQFEALGLTGEGQVRTPGVGALRSRLGNLREQIKGTVLDTAKTESELNRIAKVLSGKFGKVGRDVRTAVLEMLNAISGALKSGDKPTEAADRLGGEITRGGIRSTQRLLRGLNLSEEERRIIQQRNLGRTGRRGLSAFGFAVDQPSTFGTGAAAGAGAGNIFISQLTVVTNDPNDLMKKLQKKGRRSAGGRRGRHGGANLGLN